MKIMKPLKQAKSTKAHRCYIMAKKRKVRLFFSVFIVGLLALMLTTSCKKNNATKGLIFKELEDGTYGVESAGLAKTEELIIIPQKYKGKKVTQILSFAFENCDIQQVAIPNTITTIGACAFSGCQYLIDVDLPSACVIGEYAFSECSQLLMVYANSADIQKGAFTKCNSMVSFSISEGKIGEFAFLKCEKLQKVNIGEKVSEIGASAFQGCSKLEEVNLQNGINTIRASAFAFCSALKRIEVPKSVKKIDRSAFVASSVCEISYGGSKSQWKSALDNKYLYTTATIYGEITVHCSDGDLTEEGK